MLVAFRAMPRSRRTTDEDVGESCSPFARWVIARHGAVVGYEPGRLFHNVLERALRTFR